MKLNVWWLLPFCLIGCVSDPVVSQSPPVSAPAGMAEQEQVRVRTIDAAAQKALIDRMKNCCAEAK